MTSSSFRRKVLVLVLAGAFLVPWSLAAEPRGLPEPGYAQAVAWAPLDLLFRFWRSLRTLWVDNGCTIDPDGRCITGPGDGASSGTTSDNGCTIDPSGRCLSGS